MHGEKLIDILCRMHPGMFCMYGGGKYIESLQKFLQLLAVANC